METIRIKQNWKGYFTYYAGYEPEEQYKEVDFQIEIYLEGNNFSGTSSNSETKSSFDKPATVKGFFDNEKISFVLKYPCAYFLDENGEVVLDRNKEHPDIHYLGFFEDDQKKVSGNWEMTIYEERYGDGYLNEILNGTFEMRRIV